MIDLEDRLKKAVQIKEIDGEQYARVKDITEIIKKLASPGNMSKLVMGVTFNNEKAITEVFESCV